MSYQRIYYSLFVYLNQCTLSILCTNQAYILYGPPGRIIGFTRQRTYCMVVLWPDINCFTLYYFVFWSSVLRRNTLLDFRRVNTTVLIKKYKQVTDTPLLASTGVVTDVINNSHL